MSETHAGTGRRIILGMGTGRCGTHTLAELLDRQHDAHFTHEERPLLPWRQAPGRPRIQERLQRLRRTRSQRFIGDVSLFYLPYVEEAIALEPDIRFICLERPREEVVASFCQWGDTVHPLPTDHWAEEPPEGWYHDPLWTQIFPQYPGRFDREEGIRRYWDEYHERSTELARRHPRNVQIFPMVALNDENGIREVLTFAGIPNEHQVVLPGLQAAKTKRTPLHPRRAALAGAGPDDAKRCVVLVPYVTSISPACEDGLRELERRGYQVWRRGGVTAIDHARSQMATDALVLGFEETMWIDPDIKFDPDAVGRIRAHKEPIVSGLVPQRGQRKLACHTLTGTPELLCGSGGGLVEILYAAGGFLLIRHRVYMDMVQRFRLPLCNELIGRPLIPFFRPLVRPLDDGSWYLPEDYSFCEAARQCGYRVLADTTIRLWRIGQYDFGWEDTGAPPQRHATFKLRPS